MPAEMHGSEQHSLAGFDSCDVLANFHHFARNIASQNMRKLHARQSFAHPYVQVIQRARPHPHQHLIFARLGIGNLFVTQDLRTTKLMKANRFHDIGFSSLTLTLTSDCANSRPPGSGNLDSHLMYACGRVSAPQRHAKSVQVPPFPDRVRL